ncbi:Xylose isomerase domain protein TIM barrel [Beutenbergia cavernae DSM 12333]|uniref:Xylose isomerase domain protein TIM barrel n=1 Tax=Beutenbergia cavernae (strain ATCC BAA-8 / DSM 12333 / CCUG 43141 / JCM 11478 / NBRC 16432 / NCIMB 13614 / HKI 0122) TaxID=471853 RepID=C5C1J9_BEUC1|nr:sugar phosphate isomerase/epimerase family protein [Beutenbergia cavernae]ACQ81609.1 Xylose isomerase domain protein TIM barrel [Beutenbergia cavernae DSM 12333]
MTGAGLERLSLNTATVKRATLGEAVDVAARAGYGAVGLWRDRVEEAGVAPTARIVRDAGLRVSSLCRGGFLTASTDDGVRAALDDNRRAIDDAAAVGTTELVMVVGGLPASGEPGGPPREGAAPGDRDVVAARARVADRLADLAPHAADAGVRLALEPLHPMFAADRAVISTLAQALDLAAPHPADVVGVVVDTYHVWWDPALETSVARAGAERRIASYQVCDWNLPLAADPLLSRGYPGDGYVDFPAITRLVADAGYDGDVECEIFHADVWATPAADVARIVAERYATHVAPHLTRG